MEKISERFLRYVAVDTQSDPESESQPSAAKELNLLKMLKDELNAMGLGCDPRARECSAQLCAEALCGGRRADHL